MKMQEIGVSHPSVLYDAAEFTTTEECIEQVKAFIREGISYEDLLQRVEALPEGTEEENLAFESMMLAVQCCYQRLEDEERAKQIIPIKKAMKKIKGALK